MKPADLRGRRASVIETQRLLDLWEHVMRLPNTAGPPSLSEGFVAEALDALDALPSPVAHCPVYWRAGLCPKPGAPADGARCTLPFGHDGDHDLRGSAVELDKVSPR